MFIFAYTHLQVSKKSRTFAAKFQKYPHMDKISKAQVKLVRCLQQKKYRDESGLFVAEGEKCVEELRKGFELEYYITESGKVKGEIEKQEGSCALLATATEIEQMSGLRTPQGVIGVFRKSPQPSVISYQPSDLVLALDGVQDPGNLGTIIRTCDWFGVHDIICSKDTADCYNPKVVQATMGALARVRVHYTDLPQMLSALSHQYSDLMIYGTILEGDDMYEVLTPSAVRHQPSGIIVMGNEGNGITQEVRRLITHPIRIPNYPKDAETSESLNVSIATAVVLAEFRRP